MFPQVLLAKITNKQAYKDKVSGYCSYISTSQQKTPKGLVYIDQWGSLRMAANAAYICAVVIFLSLTSSYTETRNNGLRMELNDTKLPRKKPH
jgi:hypothetical protein